MLHPAIDRRMVNLNAPFQHQLLNVSVTQGVAAIPAHSLQDDLWEKVSPSE
jgi:hypothetical protein